MKTRLTVKQLLKRIGEQGVQDKNPSQVDSVRAAGYPAMHAQWCNVQTGIKGEICDCFPMSRSVTKGNSILKGGLG